MVLMWIRIFFIISICFGLINCQFEPSSDLSLTPDYYLLEAEWEYPLMPELKEVSAIVYWKNDQLIVLEDEHGIIYLLNKRGEIEQMLHFAEDGDYEGLCLVEDELWAARSDGHLFQLTSWQYWDQDSLEVSEFETQLKAKNDVEGLCFDVQTHSLLIACKGNPFLEGKNNRQFRAIYRFDLKEKVLYPKPAFMLNLEEIMNSLSEEEADFFRIENFQPSDIAIHPKTRNLYLPSAKADLILVLQQDGTLATIYPLLEQVFEQLEGISFDQEANMYLASEGRKAAARVWKFPYQQ
jgi:uncharacterized protein YjiK